MKRIILFLFLSQFSISILAQDLYDEESTGKFAEYLLESGQPEFAIKEFERLVFLDSSASSPKLNLLKAYRLAGQFEKGISRGLVLFDPPEIMPRPHALEFSKLLMSQRNWPLSEQFWLKSQTLTQTDKVLMQSTVHIFNSDFLKAQALLITLHDSSNFLETGYLSIVSQALNGKSKSPLLAGTLSAMIPGLGKVYTGDWKDGLVSLIFTSGMAIQAVRKFNRFGPNNFRPWLYTSIGTGFYLGNVYGSVKSAQNKNRKRINLLQHEASHLFNTYY